MMNEPMTMENTMPMDGGAAHFQNAQKVKIKRVGARPLQFDGTELGMAMSFSPANAYWYEINIYRTAESRFVLAVRLFFQSDDEQDVVKAWELETFGQVMDALETYDAADDVRVRIDAADADLSLPELAAKSFALRAEAAAARQQYQGLVGQILHELDVS